MMNLMMKDSLEARAASTPPGGATCQSAVCVFAPANAAQPPQQRVGRTRPHVKPHHNPPSNRKNRLRKSQRRSYFEKLHRDPISMPQLLPLPRSINETNPHHNRKSKTKATLKTPMKHRNTGLSFAFWFVSFDRILKPKEKDEKKLTSGRRGTGSIGSGIAFLPLFAFTVIPRPRPEKSMRWQTKFDGWPWPLKKTVHV